jgi:hypothetical protein
MLCKRLMVVSISSEPHPPYPLLKPKFGPKKRQWRGEQGSATAELRER